MATPAIIIEDFAKEMEKALRAVLPTHVKDVRVTPKSVCAFLDEKRDGTSVSRVFDVDNHGDWHLRAIEWSPTGRTATESGRIHPYSRTERVGLASKAADWFSRGSAEVAAQ